MLLRLQRFLARAGVSSRRNAEELILAGRVTVNGRVVRELGTRVDPHIDRVEVDRRRVVTQQYVWLVLNKPPAVVSTVDDPEGRETVLDVVGPQPGRLYPVGRLDYHTQGVLLLTNDGDLAHALTHPRHRIPRVYHVKLRGTPHPEQIDRLRQGVRIETDGRPRTVAAEVLVMGSTGKHTWVQMTLHQGLNRQIHRMVEAVGGHVLKLIRIAFGEITVEGLSVGKHRSLTQKEVNNLRAAVALGGATTRPREAARSREAARPRRSPARTRPKSKTSPPPRRRPDPRRAAGGPKPTRADKPGSAQKPTRADKPDTTSRPTRAKSPGPAKRPARAKKTTSTKKKAITRKPASTRKPAHASKSVRTKKPASAKKQVDTRKTANDSNPASAKKSPGTQKPARARRPDGAGKRAPPRRSASAKKPPRAKRSRGRTKGPRT
jgi:23S rRNA pseudouridine2605 synthase